MVYGVVRQNKGFITVYSEVGHGSTFTVYLPETAESPLVRDESCIRLPMQGSETILVVEDEESILDLCRTILEQTGYRVFTASTPLQAIDMAESAGEPIHLLITDVVMPEMSGKELKDRLAGSHPGMQVLFMSGYTSDVIAHRGILEKDVHFIQKPFPLTSLAQKVRGILDQHEAEIS
jgi:DNA-binding NtrC family response regulator